MICDNNHLMPGEITAQRGAEAEVTAGAGGSSSSFCSHLSRPREPSLCQCRGSVRSGTVGDPRDGEDVPWLVGSGIQYWGQKNSHRSHGWVMGPRGRHWRQMREPRPKDVSGWLPEITQHSGKTELCPSRFSNTGRKWEYWKIFLVLLLVGSFPPP